MCSYKYIIQAFFSELPPDWDNYQGYLTIDGEHHNARGADLVRNMFLNALDACYDLWDSTGTL